MMLESQIDLKEKLNFIKINNYVFSQTDNLDELINQMLANIGSTDPVLRDELIYTTFVNLIYKSTILNSKLSEIAKIILDNDHLFYKIGETNTDSVFTRSFSVLLFPLILINNRKNNILSKDMILEIYHKVTKYYAEEKDLRGFTGDKGWAHATAHGADALDDLALCPEISREQLKVILGLLGEKICTRTILFIDGEDQRLVTPVISIMSRHDLSEEEIKEWITNLAEITLSGNYIGDNIVKTNVRNFLRSFYFRILNEEKYKSIISTILESLENLKKLR